MKHCQCQLCKHGQKFYRIIHKLPKKDKAFMDQFYSAWMCTSEDLEVRNAVMAGTWPSAVEQLEIALKGARAIRFAKDIAQAKEGK